VTTGAFSDEEPLCSAGIAKNAVIDERIIEHQVRPAKPRNRSAR
jgi:hypothetical protein